MADIQATSAPPKRGLPRVPRPHLLESLSSSWEVRVCMPAAAVGSEVATGLAASWSITSIPFSSATWGEGEGGRSNHWGEPERAPHSRDLHFFMSYVRLSDVCRSDSV